jgi:hypothetical protein
MATSSEDNSTTKLLSVAKLNYDGSNSLVWKGRIEMILDYKGLSKYIEHGAKVPTVGASGGVTTDKDGTLVPAPRITQSDVTEWNQKNSQARIQICQTVDDEVFQLVLDKQNASDIWETICARYDGAGSQSAIYLLAKLFRGTMSDDSDLQSQINEFRGHARRLKAIGHPIPDDLFAAALVLALPPSYSDLAMMLTHRESLTIDTTVNAILAEETRRREAGETALKAHAGKTGKSLKSMDKKSKPKKHCTNPKCKRSGHTIETCFAEGGGQEGQAPWQKGKKQRSEEKPKELKANAKESVKIAHETDDDDDDFAVFVASEQQHAKMASKKREGSASATWIIDSGATSHVTPHISYFCSYQRLTQPCRIYLADNSYIEGIGTGTVPIEVKVGDINQKIMLQQVLHVPDASSNLLSIG